MALKDVLHGLFGGGGSAESGADREDEAVEYNGYRISAAPRRQGGQWATAGFVRKDFPDGGEKEHAFIRADTFAERSDAASLAVEKGKRLVDELGERMFEG